MKYKNNGNQIIKRKATATAPPTAMTTATAIRRYNNNYYKMEKM